MTTAVEEANEHLDALNQHVNAPGSNGRPRGAAAFDPYEAARKNKEIATRLELLDPEEEEDTRGSKQKDKKKKKPKKQQASLRDTYRFVFECGASVRIVLFLGLFGGFINGLVFPALAYLFSTSLGDLSGSGLGGDDFLNTMRDIAYTFMFVGVIALGAAIAQGWAFELVAYHASQNFRLQYFRALIRQDTAYFDVHDIGGVAAQVEPNATKYRRGLGRKCGEGVQFLVTGVGGLAYAFYSSWQVALVILAAVPFVSIAAILLLKLNQTKGARAGKTYKTAGGIAYQAVSSVKTVYSLTAVKEMVNQYKDATAEAFASSMSLVLKLGLANGTMLGSFLFLYCILTLYGTFLLYNDTRSSGCDPSGAVPNQTACVNSGADVFGAMLGIAFAAQGLSQVGNFTDALGAARVAVFEALQAIDRKPGAEREIIYKTKEDFLDELSSTVHSRRSSQASLRDVEIGDEKEIKAILPKFEIDSLSREGERPRVSGAISLQNVEFSYPTRPDDPVLQGLSLDIKPGEVVALVGPSGGGKSTVVSMLERFYDPNSGKITLDGVDLKDINVPHLRSSIGYVGQEPTLFATSIRGNIQYGNPRATQEQIEEAARLANAHDFITAFTDGYDTLVGDKGSQLSGGQKQRIAIARVLVKNPHMLILDEATSALDAESELVVQDALDNILAQKKITTIIIAHRLSTIRNADKIFVIVGGRVAEQGTHEQLMDRKKYYYRLVEKQEGGDENNDSGPPSRASSFRMSSSNGIIPDEKILSNDLPHLEFKNVVFSYPSRPQKTIFDCFNLKIHQGETVALVGNSGGGKSTTVGLVERFYDPSGGQLLYLGHDLKSLNVNWYRSQLAYVGQEPVLFNMTIAENIAFGTGGATRAEIEEAAKQANAHQFIVEFPEGYDTPVGARGTQLSGGQKQRVAIARALVRRPKVLILDEATSALDNESEAIVQAAIDRLMQSKDHTVIVIAHRLSTIRNADRIALISDGKVLEYGSHDELIEKPNGRYKRLFESSKRRSTVDSVGLRRSTLTVNKVKEEEDDDEEIDWEAKIKEEEEKAFSAKRARQMAAPDTKFILAGAIGAVICGGVFPLWGILFSETINLLFTPVLKCNDSTGVPPPFLTCEDYWNSTADYMRTESFKVAGYWAALFVGCILGNLIMFWGFGTATERLNKRIRDSSFLALLRQEVAFFDKRSVGSITSQLQDDAARIQAFSGEPVRSFIIAIASIITGIVISLVVMWPFALVAIGCIPIMGLATSIHMKRMLGEDEGDLNAADELNSPGGLVVETLVNIKTVSALTLEARRYRDYENALLKSEPNYRVDAFMDGLTAGLSMFIQQWINALQFYFGGWLLFRFPDLYTFENFLIAQFSILFGLFGLGAAFQDMSDRKEVEKSAGRIFYLLDRQSEIDPLSDEGKKLD